MRVAARLRQAEAGNLGDWASAGGDKKSQVRDIKRAHRIAAELGEDL